MTLNTPQDYTVEIVDGIRYAIRTGGVVCSFTAPATTRGLAKLYTVSRAGALLYVGIAEQPMSARLNFGFKASGKGGYHGYKWKNLTERLALSVWTAHGEGGPVAFVKWRRSKLKSHSCAGSNRISGQRFSTKSTSIPPRKRIAPQPRRSTITRFVLSPERGQRPA